MPKNKWYERIGPEGDVAISTRIRLARNIRGIAFPGRMTPDQRRVLADRVQTALGSGRLGAFRRICTATDPAVTVAALVEQHAASPEFAALPDGVLLLSDDNAARELSIMICEEDHLRLQVMQAGLSLKEAHRAAEALDDLLDSKFSYAFDESLGFLTRCPTNLGTGLRASVMLHLPALETFNMLPRIENSLSKLGLTIRGTYGEGSGCVGSLYQISNQITLGISEEDAIENLGAIVGQIIAQERELRGRLKDNDEYVDRVRRAAGILQNARILGAQEFYQLISLLRTGISIGEIRGVGLDEAGALIWTMGSASLIEMDGTCENPAIRDKTRASLVRKYMAGYCPG